MLVAIYITNYFTHLCEQWQNRYCFDVDAQSTLTLVEYASAHATFSMRMLSLQFEMPDVIE